MSTTLPPVAAPHHSGPPLVAVSRKVPALASARPPATVIWSVLAGLGLFLIRVPFFAPTLANWDAIQFALATQRFDLDLYQPHAPGYLVYVGLGSLLTAATGDPNLGYQLLSAASAAVASVAFWHLAGRLGLRGSWHWLTATAFALSPLLWYASTVALTYALECAAVVIIAGLAWRASQRRSAGWLVATAVAIGLAGGIRQTSLLLVLPLLVWGAWHVRRPAAVLVAAGAGLLAVAAWAVPLLLLAGGPAAYLAVATRLAGDVLLPASRDLGLWSVVLNSGYTVIALLMALGAAVFSLPWSIAGWRRPGAPPPTVTFLLLWGLPPILLFATIHIGQPGYTLIILAPLLILLGLGLQRRADEPATQRGDRPGLVLLAAAACIASGLLGHQLIQRTIDRVEALDDPASLLVADLAVSHAPLFGLRRMQIDWPSVQRVAADYGPGELVVFTSAGILGAFRHAGYYLPDQPVWGIWMTPERGFFFPALRWEPGIDYGSLNRPRDSVPLPASARAVLVIDDPFAGCLTLDAPIETIPIGSTAIYRIPLEGQTTLGLTTRCLPP